MKSPTNIVFNKNNERIVKVVPDGYYLINKKTGKIFPPKSKAGWKGINIDKKNSDWELVSISSSGTGSTSPQKQLPITTKGHYAVVDFSNIATVLSSIMQQHQVQETMAILEEAVDSAIETLFDVTEQLIKIYDGFVTYDKDLQSLRNTTLSVQGISTAYTAEQYKQYLERFLQDETHLFNPLFSSLPKAFDLSTFSSLYRIIQAFAEMLSKATRYSEISKDSRNNLVEVVKDFVVDASNVPIKAVADRQKLYIANQKLKIIRSILHNITLVEQLLLGTNSYTPSLNSEIVDGIFFNDIQNLKRLADTLKETLVNIPLSAEATIETAIRKNLMGNVFLLLSNYMSSSETVVPNSLDIKYIKGYKTTTAKIEFKTTEPNGTTRKYVVEFLETPFLPKELFSRVIAETHSANEFFGLAGLLHKYTFCNKIVVNIIEHSNNQTKNTKKNLIVETTIKGSFVANTTLQLLATHSVKEESNANFLLYNQNASSDISYLFYLLDHLPEIYKSSVEALRQGFFLNLLHLDNIRGFVFSLEFLSVYPVLVLTKNYAQKNNNPKDVYEFYVKTLLDSVMGRRFLLSDTEKPRLDASISVDYVEQRIHIPMPELIQLSLMHIVNIYKASLQSANINVPIDISLSDESEAIKEIQKVPMLNSLYFDDNATDTALKFFETKVDLILQFLGKKLLGAKNTPTFVIAFNELVQLITRNDIINLYNALGSNGYNVNYNKLIRALVDEINSTFKVSAFKSTAFVKRIKGPLFEILFENIINAIIKTGSFHVTHNFLTQRLSTDRILIKTISKAQNKTGFGDCRLFIFNTTTGELYPLFIELKATKPKIQAVYSLRETFNELLQLEAEIHKIIAQLKMSPASASRITVKTIYPLTLGINAYVGTSVVGNKQKSVRNFRVVFFGAQGGGSSVDTMVYPNMIAIRSNYVILRPYGLIGFSLFTPEIPV